MKDNIGLLEWLQSQSDYKNEPLISDLNSYSIGTLKSTIVSCIKCLKEIRNKEIILKFNINSSSLDDIQVSCPILKLLNQFVDLCCIQLKYFKVGIDSKAGDNSKLYISLYIDKFDIKAIKELIQNQFDLFPDFLNCIYILYKSVNPTPINIPDGILMVEMESINKHHNIYIDEQSSNNLESCFKNKTAFNNDKEYLSVCNDAVNEEQKSDFSIKTLDCYLMTEKEWFLEQCEHILHIANIMDGIDDNDLLEDNWTIDINKCNKMINSIKYRTNPFNRNLYIKSNYPLSNISELEIQKEQLKHLDNLKYLYRQFNAFLYSSMPLKKFEKTVNTIYNEYKPYSIYRLSKDQVNYLSILYNIKQKNIVLESSYDFIQND